MTTYVITLSRTFPAHTQGKENKHEAIRRRHTNHHRRQNQGAAQTEWIHTARPGREIGRFQEEHPGHRGRYSFSSTQPFGETGGSDGAHCEINKNK